MEDDRSDEPIRRLFGHGHTDIVDDGFAREVMRRVERLRRRRRLVLSAAVLAGAALAVPALLPGLAALAHGIVGVEWAGLVRGLETAPTIGAAIAGGAANIAALCAFAAAVWLVSVGAEP